MKPIVMYSLGVVALGWVITAIFKRILRHYNQKQEADFYKDAQEKIAILNKQSRENTDDLQEVMDIIQKEYVDIMKEKELSEKDLSE